MEPSLSRLQRQAIEQLRRYLNAPKAERTPHVRAFAQTLFEARQQFQRSDGRPDYAGRTAPYRNWVREIYGEANVPMDQRNAVQAAVSWHMSSIVREALDPATLAEHGLQPRTLSEAHDETRRRERKAFRALTARDVAGGALVAITAAHTVLAKVDAADLANLDGNAAEVARATLEDLESTARRLSKQVATGTAAGKGGSPLFRAAAPD